jgi:hypothetical protein
MPWRIPAGKTASPGSTVKLRPLGCTVTVKLAEPALFVVIFLGIL